MRNKKIGVACRQAAGEADQNRHKQLQKGSAFPKDNKNTPVIPFLLETQGFYPFWRLYPDKKETALRLSLMVREAGLEGFS